MRDGPFAFVAKPRFARAVPFPGKRGRVTQVSLTNWLRGRPTDLLGDAKTHSIILQEPPARQRGTTLVLSEQSCPQATTRDGLTQAGQMFCSLGVLELLWSMASVASPVISCNGVTGHGRQFVPHSCSLTPHGMVLHNRMILPAYKEDFTV